MTASKRRLERIENGFGEDLVCELEVGGRKFTCAVSDYNALGFRLLCRNKRDYGLLHSADISSAKIIYGNYTLGAFTFPKVLRGNADSQKLVLIPSSRSNVQIVERPRRAPVPELLEPVLTGPDPIRLNEKAVMRVDNVSEGGFRAKCSLSNRHFLQGQLHRDFALFIPTTGLFKCSFRISSVRAEATHLWLGCELIGPTARLRKALRHFMLLCLFTSKDLDLHLADERLPKRLTPILRIRRVNQDLEMDQVLSLRLRAYRAANKVFDGTQAVDMGDDYDKNSILLGAYVGTKIAGTVRVVFSRQGGAFPFEKFFRLPKGFNRERSVELSRMAVEPALQGSDMAFRMMQAAALEFVPKADHAFLMSTEDLSENYLLLGAKRLAGPVPHPVNPGENLCLFVFNTEKLKFGKMSALAWLFFAREIIDFMSRFGFAKKTQTPLIKYARMPFELGFKKFKKFLRKWQRSL